MKLLNCKIVNFGCLSNCEFNFDDGLNLLYAPNGKGKSTFAAFLKAMFYGLPSNRKTGLDNERRRYTPWQGGAFGGSLSFKVEDTEYRLERFFGGREKDDRFALYHLATGNPSTRYTEAIGEELFGVDADGFERSLYISQSSPFLSPDNNSIRARLGALLDASDDLGNFEKADELLDSARRHYRALGDRGAIPELARALSEKDLEIEAAKTAKAEAVALAEERCAIEEKKQQIAAALADAKEKLAQAEKRRLWDEKNANYLSLIDLRDATKRQLVPLEAFFAPHLPTAEELFETDSAVTDCTTLSAQLEHAHLSSEDAETLRALEARYGECAPDGEFMEKMRSALASWQDAKDEVRAIQLRLNAERDPLVLKFKARPPKPEELVTIEETKAALEEASAHLYTEEKPKQSPLFSLGLPIAGGVLTLSSVLLFIFALWAVATVTLVFGLAAIGFWGYTLLRNAKKPGEFLAHLEDFRAKQKLLSALLMPFGYFEKDPLLSTAKLFDDLARYHTLCEEEKEGRIALAKLEAVAKEKEAALRAHLSRFDGTDLAREAARIESEVPVFRLLLQKRLDLAARREMLTAEREKASRKISAFLSYYPSLATLSPREALDTVKQNMLLSKQALAAHDSARNRIANYLQSTRFDPDAPPPPYQGDLRTLKENEASLQKALMDLEALSSVKENERRHKEEIAHTIPNLLAEREAIATEKQEAEHTLSLILTTKDILKDAKEDLSTRYLRDMEMHFDRYYQKLTKDVTAELPADGSRVSRFTMDTSLALSYEAYGERRPVAALSRGERDLAAFCARLALLEAIFTKEPPFLLFDDPFINLDDESYQKATTLLPFLAERFQMIYSVCSKVRLPADIPLKSLDNQP